MITKDAVESEAKEVLETSQKTEGQFVAQQALQIFAFLDQSKPNAWNMFGPYWWALEDVLKTHAPREYREWLKRVGDNGPITTDETVKAAYDYKSDLQNMTAALMYLEERMTSGMTEPTLPHLVELNGEEKQYLPSQGFVEDSEFQTEE